LIIFHPDVGLDPGRQFDTEKADTAKQVHQMSGTTVLKKICHGFDQFGQQEKIVLKKGIARAVPSLRD
jgi:hypothetical protein